MKFTVEDLGLIEYESAWKLQDQYAIEIAEGMRPPTLLLLEHPHVYTFGRRGKKENLLWGESQLKEKGIAIHWVDRGGDVTYHGPGQLVGYPFLPVVPLGPERSFQESNPNLDTKRPVRSVPDADYVGYIRKLEKMLISTLASLGIAAGQRPGLTGVWVQADVYSRCARCKHARSVQSVLPVALSGRFGRLDEAMNELTILATGLYGMPMPNQNGAPIRLVVPWKYGFKSIKAITKIELVDEQPSTLWNAVGPGEYGFYSNVNPERPHPRWSQASERRIGEFGRRPTFMFNGYAEQVAHLYDGMDLIENY